MTNESLVRVVRNDFDWSALRFPGERSLRGEVDRDGRLRDALARAIERSSDATGRGLRVTPAVAPALCRLGELVRQIFQAGVRIELEVVADTSLWLESVPTGDSKRIAFRLGGGWIEKATLRESLFVLGRATGLVLLGQPILLIDPSAGKMDTSRETLMLRGLYRFQEMTADRFGLLCAQDSQAALTALVRMNSGLPASLISVKVDEWLADRLPEEEAMVSPRENDFLLLRAAALRKFEESDRYQQAFAGTGLDANPLPAPVPTSSPLSAGASPTIIPMRAPSAADTVVAAASKVEETVVEYRAVGGDPSVVEAVRVRTPRPASTADADGDEPFRRAFAIHAAFWIASQREVVTPKQRELLTQLFGSDVFATVRPAYEKHGEGVFATFCRESAERIRQRPQAGRQELLLEQCRLAMTDNPDPTKVADVLSELTELLGLTDDDLAMALADFVDPEFAHYSFQPGQEVDVRLDGEWISGTVELVDEESGEVRVRFSPGGRSLRLHPLADMIRPRALRAAS